MAGVEAGAEASNATAAAAADVVVNGSAPTPPDDSPCSTGLLPEPLVCVPYPEEMLDPRKHNQFFEEIVATHAAALFCGVLGNGVVLLVMLGDRKARNATNLFLGSLAAADLLLLLVFAPLDVLQYFVTEWDEVGAVCNLARAAQMLSAAASVLNLSAVTLERFLVIVFPMKSRSYCTLSNCRRAVFAVWLIAALLTAPVFLTQGTYKMVYTNLASNITLYHCTPTGVLYPVYQSVVLFGAPGILMIVCYTFVIRELWRSTRSMRVLTNSVSMRTIRNAGCTENHTQNHRSQSVSASLTEQNTPIPGISSHSMCVGQQRCRASRLSEVTYGRPQSNAPFSVASGRTTSRQQNKTDDVRKARKQVIKMLILVIVLFLICWGPRIIMEIFMKLEIITYSPTVYQIRVAIFALPVVHACMNPFIYSFMSKNFRRSLQRQLERLGCRGGSAMHSVSGNHGTMYGSSRMSRIRREQNSQRESRIGPRLKPGRGSMSSSTNCNNEFTRHTELEHVVGTADV